MESLANFLDANDLEFQSGTYSYVRDGKFDGGTVDTYSVEGEPAFERMLGAIEAMRVRSARIVEDNPDAPWLVDAEANLEALSNPDSLRFVSVVARINHVDALLLWESQVGQRLRSISPFISPTIDTGFVFIL